MRTTRRFSPQHSNYLLLVWVRHGASRPNTATTYSQSAYHTALIAPTQQLLTLSMRTARRFSPQHSNYLLSVCVPHGASRPNTATTYSLSAYHTALLALSPLGSLSLNNDSSPLVLTAMSDSISLIIAWGTYIVATPYNTCIRCQR